MYMYMYIYIHIYIYIRLKKWGKVVSKVIFHKFYIASKFVSILIMLVAILKLKNLKLYLLLCAVAQSCPTRCNPMDCSLPGSSFHGIFQAIVLDWVAISFFRGSSQPRDRTWVSRIVDRCFTIWTYIEI